MRRFPPTDELPDFVGDRISQICLNPHGVVFSFGEGTRINAEFGIEQIEPDGVSYAYDCAGWSGPPLVLHRLVNQSIVLFDRSDYRLLFGFDQGSSLFVLSQDGPYESGQIIIEGGTVVF